jgi:hypothetical protein
MSDTHEAAIPNPALGPLRVLIGRWDTLGSHPLMPGVTLHGHASFEWIEGGAFVRMRTSVEEPGIPSASAIIGTDDATGEMMMLYFDERGVSRRYEMSLADDTWRWWRNAPGFSQRYTGTIVDGGRRIIAAGELSRDGSTWEPDLELTYTRRAGER